MGYDIGMLRKQVTAWEADIAAHQEVVEELETRKQEYLRLIEIELTGDGDSE